MTHNLKIHPEYFQAVIMGAKTFEIRKNDREFEVGDLLKLSEFEPEHDDYTDRECTAIITYMTDYKQQKGYVVLSIKLLSYID
jgi:hypothetical protein